MRQGDLFEPVLGFYRENDTEAGAPNSALYAALDCPTGRDAVGKAGEPHNLAHRKVRWYQQTLRALGLIERVPGQRGRWRLTPQSSLTPQAPGVRLVAFSTDLGLALWSRSQDVFPHLDEPIHLVLTSPPYPLRQARSYGGPSESKFVDFICEALESLVRQLAPGGSIALNIANDLFLPGTPARSLYVERTVLALHDRLGLHLMDRLIWEAPNRLPGPTYWACRQRQQLLGTYEHVLWLTNDPRRCISDNRRVLLPHTPRHLQLMERGGEHRQGVTGGDGAHRLRRGSFGSQTPGRIARNVLRFTVGGPDRAARNEHVREAGLFPHGAPMPRPLARFLIEFLTEPGQLVAEPFAGDFTTPIEAELTGRRWIATELMAEYAAAGALHFVRRPGFETYFVQAGRKD